MACNVVAQFLACGQDICVFLQGRGHAKHCQGQLAFFKFTQNAPDACTGAIFVNAFHADVAFWIGGRAEHFRQELLRACIAMQHRILATFFVVQNKLNGNASLPRPLGVGHVTAIALEVTGVGGCGVVVCVVHDKANAIS